MIMDPNLLHNHHHHPNDMMNDIEVCVKIYVFKM